MSTARLVTTFDPDETPRTAQGSKVERAAFAMYRQFISGGSRMFDHGQPRMVDEFTARRRWAGMPERTRQGWRDLAQAGLEASA